MRGTRRSKVWLALGLVAMACLVLAGCPHNNRLEGGGGAGSGGGSRGGSGGVQLVITNFVSEEGAANRSASWLGGPQRTIVPEHIDLTDQAEIEKYVFVANGTGSDGTTYGPAFIDIAETTGTAFLGITGSGIWDITVDAYSIGLLTTPPGAGITGTDQAAIMAQPTNLTAIEAKKADARVLTGRATVDLANGGQVTMTLTNDGVGSQGNVNLDIYFRTPEDKQRIQQERYEVKAALYDFVTGEMVQDLGTTENILINAGDPPGDPDTYTANAKKGRYQFRLTVIDQNDNPVAYYVDDIYVEGNRSTEKDVEIYELFQVVEAPKDVKVFWQRAPEGTLKDGYLATVTWSPLAYNAVGLEMEVADITDYYSYDDRASQYKVNFTGVGAGSEEVLAARTNLWENQIDNDDDVKTAVVTKLSWSDSPQGATRYPIIWQDGSLLNGSTQVSFLMQSGHVYSLRVRADGSQTPSDWLILSGGDGTAKDLTAGGPPAITEFDGNPTTTAGLFGLVQVTYDLEDKFLLYKTGAGNAVGTKAVASDLLVYHQYDPTTGYTIDKKYNTDIQTTNEGDWFVYKRTGRDPANVNERIMTWTGWQDTNNPTNKYTATTWGSYNGHRNLHLVTVGASGDLIAQAETSGTFDVLTKDTVLIAIDNDATKTVVNAAWTELTNGDDNPTAANGGGAAAKTVGLGLMNDTAKNRYILNLNRGGGTRTFLYVAVGKEPTAVGTLEDKNTNEFTVGSIEVTLTKGLATIATFTPVSGGGAAAYHDMSSVSSGDYVLRVRITTSSGYEETFQTTLAVKYDDQVIQ